MIYYSTVMSRKPYPTKPISDRFWAKVNRSGPLPPRETLAFGLDPCWIWLGNPDREGYGRFYIDRKTGYMAHRYSYALAKGPIPRGLVLDHLCQNPSCVNPKHLEPVTIGENIRRGKRRLGDPCSHGHDPSRSYMRTDAARPGLVCRDCQADNRATARRNKELREKY